MKVIVTGGAGFIASNLVDELVKRGDDVLIIDDLSTGKISNMNLGASFEEMSICEERLEKVFKKFEPEVVFHLAAWARVPRSIEDPVGTNMVNVDGTINVLKASKASGVKRVVYSSSSSVYGLQDTHIMTEYMDKRPMSPYALQKWVSEQYCDLFVDLFDMSIVSLRYFNVYGHRQITEGAYSLVIGKFIKQKENGEKMTVYGDGTQTRAYTHITDVVKANILASKYNMKIGHQVFNIGTTEESSVNEIAKLLGGEVKYINPNPRGKFEEKRKVADNSLAKEKLGWEPKISIKEGIKDLKK